jgi:Flp pilus assembly protein protease CpaA
MVGAFVHPLSVMLVLLVGSVGGAVLGGVYVAVRSRRLAPASGTIQWGDEKPVAYSSARVRAPRRKPITVGVPVDPATARDLRVGAPATLAITLPGAMVWSDDGRDVALSVRGTVVAIEPRDGGSLVILELERLSEEDEDWLSTFALNRISIPFGVFLALGAAAVLLFGPEIHTFVMETWPRFVSGR